MPANLSLVLWVILGLIATWFFAMTVNRNMFLHSDIDRTVYGTMIARDTDIGTQCGEALLPSELVEYKLNMEGKIIYLCPQGLWPIQATVVANTITDAFKQRLRPDQLTKINNFYPKQTPEAPGNPFVVPR